MSRAQSDGLIALVTHARQVPAQERERFGRRIRHEFGPKSLMLETCHRVEAYAFVADHAPKPAVADLLPAGGRLLTGEQVVRHAIAVAAGRDSVVVGEGQVIHQLRDAVDAARQAGALDPILERLFAHATRAGRRARSWQQGPVHSLADVALAAIERRVGSVSGRDVLVVGAGTMGRLAARAAAASGASLTVANRSSDRAQVLAAQNGGVVEAFDPGSRAGGFAGVVVALAGPWAIGPAAVEALGASTSVVVDLSVPAAVPPRAAEALGSRYVSGDDLALAEAEPELLPPASLARLERLIDSTTAEFLDWLSARDGRAAANALIERADREREAELAALTRRLPDLQPEALDAIDAMTRHLTARLLREPLERLGRDPDGGTERVVRDIFAL